MLLLRGAFSSEHLMFCANAYYFPEISALLTRRSGVSPDFSPLLAGGNTKGGIFKFRSGESTMTIPAKAGIQIESLTI